MEKRPDLKYPRVHNTVPTVIAAARCKRWGVAPSHANYLVRIKNYNKSPTKRRKFAVPYLRLFVLFFPYYFENASGIISSVFAHTYCTNYTLKPTVLHCVYEAYTEPQFLHFYLRRIRYAILSTRRIERW